jgi:hypothetical protein
MLDAHVEETISRWLAMERAEQEYRRWATFFYPLLGKPELARVLCDIGLSVVRRQTAPGPDARNALVRILRESPAAPHTGDATHSPEAL